MTTLVDDILADIAARSACRTRYEGQPPREDEALAGEIATLRAENARLREAITLAVGMLSQDEPGDSRAASNEFVALAAVQCGIANDKDWVVIRAALAPQEPDHG